MDISVISLFIVFFIILISVVLPIWNMIPPKKRKCAVV